MLRGIAVSPGVVVAPALVFDQVWNRNVVDSSSAVDTVAETARFQRACDQAAVDLNDLIQKVSLEIGPRESAIFQAHLYMLRDRGFASKVKAIIVEKRTTADAALQLAMLEYEKLFADIQDEYLRERIVDLRDVVLRVERHLTADVAPPEATAMQGSVIAVARELSPSRTINVGGVRITGIVTEIGGGTSHAAIIARSMGVPAVTGIPDILRMVKSGDMLAVDGRDGCVLVNPGPEAEAAYRKLQREFATLKTNLFQNRDQPANTRDGESISLLANVNNVDDARDACGVGADGIGLFRTEYLFLTHPSIPDEEEQYGVYKAMCDASPPGGMVTIRTLDLGGDKNVPYLGNHRESNPFLGWRSIRLIFEHPEFFSKQLRAILRASADGCVQLLFPMITTVDELRRANRMLEQARRQLEDAGVPHDKAMKRGIMIEIPAAAICVEHLIRHADFVSIGTNDLVQYVVAADRDNAKVAHLCDPLNPAVLRLLNHVIDVCNDRQTPVTVCGEMAGLPRCVLLLLAFGLRSFSMSPGFIPAIKELIHSVSLSDRKSLARDVLRRRSAAQVRKLLTCVLHDVNPRLAMMEFV